MMIAVDGTHVNIFKFGSVFFVLATEFTKESVQLLRFLKTKDSPLYGTHHSID